MKTEAEKKGLRTPLPWGIEETENTLWIGKLRDDGKCGEVIVAIETGAALRNDVNEKNIANAAHIVRSVNAHDDLLAAARAVLNEFVAPDEIMRASTMKTLRDAILKAEDD